MKILFSSYHNPHFLTITEYIENALMGMGHELVVFDDRQHRIPGRIRRRWEWLNRLDLRKINADLIALARRVKPDVAIVAGGHRILPETVNILKQNGAITVLWTIDAPVAFKPVLAAAPCYDHIFCQGTEAMELLEQAGVDRPHWLPMACDPDKHRRVAVTAQEREAFGKDIVFVGSYYPNRWDVLKNLQDHRLGIWGPNWHKAEPGRALPDAVCGGQLPHSDWVKVYSAAKIIVVVHYRNDSVPCRQASPKVFEALACRGFVMVDRQPDVFALFDDGIQLVGFDDGRDLRRKIDYYLQHPAQRDRIAGQGHETVIARHTYRHRVAELLTIAGCRQDHRRGPTG